MTCAPTKIPYCFAVGEKHSLRIDFTPDLEDGETLTGTPEVTEVGGSSTLSIGTPNVNASTYTSKETGEIVAVSHAVIATIEIIAAKNRTTIIRVKCGTTNASHVIINDFEFQTKV